MQPAVPDGRHLNGLFCICICITVHKVHEDAILDIQLPVAQGPVDLVPLLQAHLLQPLASSLTCLALLGCPPAIIPCSYIPQPGNVMLLKLPRLRGPMQVSTVPFYY